MVLTNLCKLVSKNIFQVICCINLNFYKLSINVFHNIQRVGSSLNPLIQIHHGIL